ncbi:MAG: hypothetical protein IJT23_01560 [Clostridia bacterium]|nr:hypothetical protein [Clostridia bacterium]
MRNKKIISLIAILAMMMLCAVGVQAMELTEDFTLNENLTEQITVKSGAEVTLNLNGYNITAPEGQDAIINNGTLTITGDGEVTGSDEAIKNAGGTLTVNGGTYKGTVYNAIFITGGDSVTINGGTFIGAEDAVCVSSSAPTIPITITGGVFTPGGNFWAVVAKGETTISGGTFNGGVYNSDDSSDLSISNGTFYGEISGKSQISNGEFHGNVVDAGVISNGKFYSFKDGSTAYVSADTVTGGVFNTGVELNPSGNISGCTVYGALKRNSSGGTISFAAGDTYAYGHINNKVNLADGAVVHTNANTTYSAYVMQQGYGIVNNKLTKVGINTVLLHKGNNCKSVVRDATSGSLSMYFWTGADNSQSTLGTDSNHAGIVAKGETIELKAVATPNDAPSDGVAYEFKGWYTTPDGKDGMPVFTDELLDNVSYTPEESVVLYAVYEEVASADAADKITQANTWLGTYGGYTNGTSFDITSKEDMNAFAYAVNILGYDFSQKTVNLKQDLDYTNDTFTIIGYKKDYKASDGTTVKGKYFSGTFNGNGNTISNVALSDDTYVGLFGYAKKATVTDLTVSNSTFSAPKATGFVGAFVGMGSNITLTNCKSVNNTITYGYHAGGMVGNATGLTLNNVEVSGLTITASTMKDGAIVGYVCDLTVNGATVSNVTFPQNYTGDLGAIAGHVNTGTNTLNDIVVNTPDLYLISTTYSGEKTVTLSGNNTNVTAKGIVKELVAYVDLTISGGNYTVNTIANVFGSSEGRFFGENAAVEMNITGGTFSSIKTVYNKITDNATANVDSSLVDDGTSGITTELLKQCTDEGGFIQDSEGNWVLEKANVVASAPKTTEEQLITHIDAYVDEANGGYGNFRVITDVSMTGSPVIESYGTYFISGNDVDKALTNGTPLINTINAAMTFSNNQFAADLVKIPEANFNDSIAAVSFVKPAGLEIKTVTFVTTFNEALAHHND